MSEYIYLDNAATSWPKPKCVLDAMQRFQSEDAGNPGRAGHRMSLAAERMLGRVRKGLTELCHTSGGGDSARMILTFNATDALNLAIKGVIAAASHSGKSKKKIPHVVTGTLEHNSVNRPLQTLVDRGEITLTRVGIIKESGLVDPAAIAGALLPETVLVILTHASNVTGVIQPIAEVGRIVHDHGSLFLVDAAQTMGVLPLDVAGLGIDLLAFPGHKGLLGPTGTGGLYLGPRIDIKKMIPWREGGTGGDSSFPTMPEEWPYYLEGGTPNILGLAGLEAALDYLKQRSVVDIHRHEQQLVQHLLTGLGEDSRYWIHHKLSDRVGTLSLNLHPNSGTELGVEEIGAILDDSFEIAVRTGLHCAPYAHRELGTFPHGTIRISPGAFNTVEQMTTLVDALKQIAGG